MALKLICWRVGPGNFIWAPLTAIVTLLITHICCWGPVFLIPLGFGGASTALNQITALKPILYLIMILLLLFLGWRTYFKSQTGIVSKISFWLAVLIVGWSIIGG